MDLTGKIALVTGASSGIGAATARALGARGCKLLLTARRAERLESIAKDIEAAGSEALVLTANVRREEEFLAVFKGLDDHFGKLDILINNAGMGRTASIHDGATDHWREMLEVNVLALTVGMREALARFPERGGHIVNISSMSGHRIPGKGSFYGATKFAVKCLTEVARRELRDRGSRSRITAISPGFVDTEFFLVLTGDEEKAKDVLAKSVDKALAPEDIASAVIYALEAPAHASIHDILMRPTSQVS
jgi:17beta-estradiol 17-dehydrogenase / 3beta-hydroxysteroid 3-dehydrogenase